MRIILLPLSLVLVFCVFPCNAKKVKNSFKIEKKSEIKAGKNQDQDMEGIKFLLSSQEQEDSIAGKEGLYKISFSGFEKEANSSKETFLVTNGSEGCLTGFTIRIDYLDLRDRMLHSRELTEKCYVPSGETRKIDVKAWDLQHTYYYYLGNEPKKVATPFKVRIVPICVWVEEYK